ncbi:uncharacterized protein PAC_17533 [Phialocephala subalpina]|uniref:Uncharacterized protein n=1 Tax=Phialocephala subalpina TaxID=576137 RepID=A0A1L7XRG5_9HELO|nr:uncharacterized protein PAC_17533 [Phialocephala subalpina]
MQDDEVEHSEARFNILPRCLLSKSYSRSIWASAFPGYARLVRDYTKRHLSHSSDALNAFSELLELFKHRFDGEIICGLPSRGLDEALLWILADDRQHPVRNVHFPSWSWAGLIGPVDYWPPPNYYFFSGLYDGADDDSDTVYATKLTRKLKTSIAQFYFSGQLLEREIDRSSSNMKYPELNTSSTIGGQEYPAEKRISRDVLEFDALIVNITKVPVHHLRLLQRYSAASVIETVACL